MITKSRPVAELILRWFEAVPGGPGESQDKGKEAQEGFQRPRGVPPSSSKALLGLFSLILAFPWAPLELPRFMTQDHTPNIADF